MSEKNKHSVRLDSDKCKGCTTCLKRCPTEAIRIRGGKAFINKDKCIDCGECIRLCPYQAKKATHDDISDLDKFKYKIALPAPSLYGQFNNLDNIGYIIKGLRDIGFDDVFEVACAAERQKTCNKLCLSYDSQTYKCKLPLPLRKYYADIAACRYCGDNGQGKSKERASRTQR